MKILASVFMSSKKKVQDWLKTFWANSCQSILKSFPTVQAWRGAGIGIGVIGYLITIIYAVELFLPVGVFYFLLAVLLFPVAYGLAAALVLRLIRSLLKVPDFLLWSLSVGILMVAVGLGKAQLPGIFAGVILIILGALLGSAIWSLAHIRWHDLPTLQRVTVLLTLVLGLFGMIGFGLWFLSPGWSHPEAINTIVDSNLPSLAEHLPDPSSKGSYPVRYFTYGSGTDKRRTEFAEGVTISTKPVDGSAFVGNWTGLRTLVWGFDEKELPLNGRVWLPDGEGSFPLILIVHGNHLAEKYSDTGYDYLCELLASRGSICVSVDENFLNGSAVGDLLGLKGLDNENDLRGWLLLKHLSVWEGFMGDSSSPLYGKVDLDKIALIGHSRGGEAVAVAAAFNRLDRYPDNAHTKFDFGFEIQAVIAIAPIDRQYQPAGEPIPLQDINYLVLQGAHDMDVSSFDGYNAFERVQYSGNDFFFKSTLYIWGANHGQFNSVWGNDDIGKPGIWLYNRAQLMQADAQRTVVKVYISAFIEAALNENLDYLPIFQNYQTGLGWLPDTIYINAYGDSETDYLLTFEEDVDVATGTKEAVRINTWGLDRWHEDRVSTKWGQMTSNNAVHLGWTDTHKTPSYSIFLENNRVSLTDGDQLIFSAAQTGDNLNDQDIPIPIDFTVVLVDVHGNTAELALSSISALQPEINAEILKLGFLSKDKTSEVVFQTYLFDLIDFLETNPSFSLEELYEIRLDFDRTPQGRIVLDNLGFRKGAIHSTEQ